MRCLKLKNLTPVEKKIVLENGGSVGIPGFGEVSNVNVDVSKTNMLGLQSENDLTEVKEHKGQILYG